MGRKSPTRQPRKLLRMLGNFRRIKQMYSGYAPLDELPGEQIDSGDARLGELPGEPVARWAWSGPVFPEK